MTLRVSAAVVRASSCVRRSSLCRTASMYFSPKTFFTDLTTMRSVRQPARASENVLTRPSLLELSGCQSERGQQLHHDIRQYLVHRGRRRDLYIYIETTEEIFDGFEQVDDCFIAIYDVFGHLVRLDVTRICTWELEKAHTASRIARPACIAFTGGNCYENRQS